MIYNELPTAFPWYDKIEKQQRFREHAAKMCDYKLVSSNNRLLPFQFRTEYSDTPAHPGSILSWKLFSVCGGVEIDISENLSLISIDLYEDGSRVTYNGEPLLFVPGTPLKADAGSYYSEIIFQSGAKYYSEVFSVENTEKYMRIDFWNSCDIAPIAYSTGFKQTMYIDSFIHTSEPEVEEDGERDGDDMLIPTFQRMIVRYRFTAMVPDYIKIALASLQIHDNVFITTENEARSGRADRISTTTAAEGDGAYSSVDVIIDQHVMVKKACCSNMEQLSI